MTEALRPFFFWAEATALGDFFRTSIWAFPLVQAVHLLGLCLLGGAVLIVDLRLLGVGLRDREIGELIRETRRWLVAAILLLVVTGICMFAPAAGVRYFINTSFWVKMSTLPIALIFTFGMRELLVRREGVQTSRGTRVVGALSIALWFVVAAAGRWIGFS